MPGLPGPWKVREIDLGDYLAGLVSTGERIKDLQACLNDMVYDEYIELLIKHNLAQFGRDAVHRGRALSFSSVVLEGENTSGVPVCCGILVLKGGVNPDEGFRVEIARIP